MFEGLIQPMHLLVILVVVLVVFGPGKLPELGKSLGEAIRGFKKALDGEAPDPNKPPEISNNKDKTKMN